MVKERIRHAFRAALITILEEVTDLDLDACLTSYSFPKEHWKMIWTNNAIERLFGEVKHRSHKMASAFRNEDSCILLFYAVIRSLKFNKLTMPVWSQAQPNHELICKHQTNIVLFIVLKWMLQKTKITWTWVTLKSIVIVKKSERWSQLYLSLAISLSSI